MKVESLSKEVLVALRKRLSEEFEKVGNEFGVQIKMGNGTFNSNDAKFSITVECEEKEKSDFFKMCHLYYLEKEDFGKKIKVSGEEYSVIGILRRSHKFPILIEDSYGKRKSITAKYVYDQLHK